MLLPMESITKMIQKRQTIEELILKRYPTLPEEYLDKAYVHFNQLSDDPRTITGKQIDTVLLQLDDKSDTTNGCACPCCRKRLLLIAFHPDLFDSFSNVGREYRPVFCLGHVVVQNETIYFNLPGEIVPNEYVISLWVKFNDISNTSMNIFTHSDWTKSQIDAEGAGNHGYELYLKGGNLEHYPHTTIELNRPRSNSKVLQNDWYHVLIRAKFGECAKMYINGYIQENESKTGLVIDARCCSRVRTLCFNQPTPFSSKGGNFEVKDFCLWKQADDSMVEKISTIVKTKSVNCI